VLEVRFRSFGARFGSRFYLFAVFECVSFSANSRACLGYVVVFFVLFFSFFFVLLFCTISHFCTVCFV